MEWDFEAEVWLWKSDASWHFLTVPKEVADEIEDMPMNRGGFGSVRVEVTIGSSTWQTSLFPSKEIGSFVLPLKKPVRGAEGLGVGDVCSVRLRIAE
ncbi:MAG: DUF1905 domain-containing protein [Actinomycetota bacterium]|nr:DUF1905 domain-containing protein [Actinomycetota bacterium]